MFKIIGILVLALVGMVGYALMSASALPDWYVNDSAKSSNDPVEEFTKIIQKQGIESFFSDKLSDLLAGKLRLGEDEFSALILTSLNSDETGRELLSVSDQFKSSINQEKIEIGAVIDIQKLKHLKPKLTNKILEIGNLIPALKEDKVYLAVSGKPMARNGELAMGDDLTVIVGKLQVPQFVLSALGVSLEKLQRESLKIRYLKIKDIALENKNIDLAVSPVF